MIPTIYTLVVLSVVMAAVGFTISFREMVSLWREYWTETVCLVEPIRRRNRHVIVFEAALAVIFIVFSVVIADQRFSFVTASCVMSLCGAIALQALIKFIYHLEPATQ